MKTIVWVWFLFQVHGVPAYVKYLVDSLPECIQSINKHYPRVVKSFPDAVALCEKTSAPVSSPWPKEKPEVSGYFQKNTVRPDINKKWLTRCQHCVGKGNSTENADE